MPLQNQFFFHDTQRKNLLAFGSLFDNLWVVRNEAGGVENQRERVPLTYGPKEKWTYGNNQDPEFKNPLGIKLPRLTYEVTNIQYAPERAYSQTQRIMQRPDTHVRNKMYQPVPYDLNIQVYLLSRNLDEGLQVVEQIIPFFTPDVTLTLKLLTGVDHKLDVPVTLRSISHTDTWDDKFENIRVITWNFDFVMKTYFYGPIKTANIILDEEITIRDGDTGTPMVPDYDYHSGAENVADDTLDPQVSD